jgi:hypothetical protein
MYDQLIYVVAGTYSQAWEYATTLDRSGLGQGRGEGPRPWLYVTGPNFLRDRPINPDRVHYTGTWAGRPDKQAILDAIALSAYQEQP